MTLHIHALFLLETTGMISAPFSGIPRMVARLLMPDFARILRFARPLTHIPSCQYLQNAR